MKCPLSCADAQYAFCGEQLFGRCPLTVILHLLQLEESEDWVDHVDDIVTRFEEETGRRPIYSVMFY